MTYVVYHLLLNPYDDQLKPRYKYINKPYPFVSNLTRLATVYVKLRGYLMTFLKCLRFLSIAASLYDFQDRNEYPKTLVHIHL